LSSDRLAIPGVRGLSTVPSHSHVRRTGRAMQNSL
jgi:hypothetical protein